MKKRYAIAGASGRGYRMYGKAITERYSDVADLVGIFDPNYLRAQYVRDHLDPSIPTYVDFDLMCEETKPDVIIVTTMDSFHHEFIVRALDKGLDVICEKPMTIDAEKTQAIFDAEQRNGKKIFVTFNYRFMPHVTKVKELINSGAIGTVTSIHYEWLLNKKHGADYFRRWHKWLRNGGGLFITKATHHFDMVNWLIEQDPVKVYANANLMYYGPKNCPFPTVPVRCTGCPYADQCKLRFTGFDDITTGTGAGKSAAGSAVSGHDNYMRGMYFNCESVDGYFRDQCLYADCDIWDNMSATVTYSEGAILTYSLQAFSPFEGVRFSVTGTKGRIETESIDGPGGRTADSGLVKLYNEAGEKMVIQPAVAEGSHGGGDNRMLDRLLRGVGDDPLHYMAGSRDGAMSILVGHAANLSVKGDKPVFIRDLVKFYE